MTLTADGFMRRFLLHNRAGWVPPHSALDIGRSRVAYSRRAHATVWIMTLTSLGYTFPGAPSSERPFWAADDCGSLELTAE